MEELGDAARKHLEGRYWIGVDEVTITPFFRWYDLWIGLYIDTANRAIYICPVPCFGVKVQL